MEQTWNFTTRTVTRGLPEDPAHAVDVFLGEVRVMSSDRFEMGHPGEEEAAHKAAIERVANILAFRLLKDEDLVYEPEYYEIDARDWDPRNDDTPGVDSAPVG